MTLGHKGFEQKETGKNSLWLDYQVLAIYEYANNKMILSLAPNDLLIVKNWESLRTVKAIDSYNGDQYHFLAHPRFDENEFPFIVCSGFAFYTLINVKEFRIEQFIDSPCCAWTA